MPPAALPGAAARTQGEDAPFVLSQEPVTPEGEALPGEIPAVPAPAYEHLGELPATYATQSVYLVAYDPGQLFVYWDVDWNGGPGTPYALHVCRADGELEQSVEIAAAEAGHYLPVRQPGGTYFVELGRHGRDGRWQVLATSTNVTMPPAGLAGETEARYATLPFHLSFQRLMELIQDAMGQGENLTGALARLQGGDRQGVTALVDTISQLGSEPLHTLESLLGQRFSVSSGGDSSLTAGAGAGGDSAHRLHRDRHDVLAAGAFGSGGLSSIDLSSGSLGGSENLSSGGFSSEGIFGGLGGSETLAAYAAGLSSESLSSFGPSSGAWRLALDSMGSGSGGFGGGSEVSPEEHAAMFLRAVESNLGRLGGLFSAPSSSSYAGS